MLRYFCCAALLLAACSDDNGIHQPIVDASVEVDSPVPMRPFLEECESDSDCLSERCVQIGERKRCTKVCTAPTDCPEISGWRCDQVCRCDGTGKQPDKCVDGDCDGVFDKPTGVEVCNDDDDDCNGVVDDVPAGTAGAKLYYRDEDGDEWGDTAQPKWICGSADGWVEKDGDCQDDEALRNPGLEEICGDLLDNDCDQDVEDPDVCGLTPLTVPDVTQPSQAAVLQTCGPDAGVAKEFDIDNIVAKQDNKPSNPEIKFTVRLVGGPETTKCATYKLAFGGPDKAYKLVYLYRPAINDCAAVGIASFEAFYDGAPLSSNVKVGFQPQAPGHVSFTIPKSELFPKVPDPTYWMRACTNADADAVKDITDCVTDSCETRVHR